MLLKIIWLYWQDHQRCNFSMHAYSAFVDPLEIYIRIEIGNANSSCYAFLYKYALYFAKLFYVWPGWKVAVDRN